MAFELGHLQEKLAEKQEVAPMGGMGRMQRMCSLHASMVRMLRHQISQQHPGLSERELRIRVAERMYMSDPGALKLLERARRQG